jgi:hypothetical protein
LDFFGFFRAITTQFTTPTLFANFFLKSSFGGELHFGFFVAGTDDGVGTVGEIGASHNRKITGSVVGSTDITGGMVEQSVVSVFLGVGEIIGDNGRILGRTYPSGHRRNGRRQCLTRRGWFFGRWTLTSGRGTS